MDKKSMTNAIKESLPPLRQSCCIQVTKDRASNIGSCNVCKYAGGEIFEIVL